MGKNLGMIARILLIIGGLNWGLEVFGWGIGSVLPSGIAIFIYALVGISALVEIFTHKSNCSVCSAGLKAPQAPETPQM